MASLPNAPNITIRPDARDQTLKFFWSAPTDNGSPAVTSYELTDGATNTVSIPPTSSFYTYTGLTNGTSYTFRIAASNTNGVGPYAFYRTVQPGLTPGIPALSTVISTSGSLQYTVGWSNPSNLGGATNLLGTLLTAYPLDANGSTITTSSLLIQTTVLGGNSNAFQQATIPLTSNYNYKVLIAPVVDAGYGRTQLFTSTISSTVTPPIIFSPSSITGMQLWLDANDTTSLVQNGPRISQWTDKAGGKNFSNATSNDSPIFDSTLKQLIFSSNALTGPSVISTNQRFLNFFAVWNVSTTTGATFQSVFEQNALANSNGYRFMVYGSPFDSRTGNFYGINGYGTSPIPTGAFPAFTVASTMVSFIGAQSDGTTFAVINRHNGALYSTQTITQANLNVSSAVTRLGRRVGGVEEPFYGRLSEILLYSTVIGANQYQVLEGYLAWKWGLSTLLPSYHPFYTRKPEITDSNLDFSPSSITNLSFWYDAADSTTMTISSTYVTSWTDKMNQSTVVAANTTVAPTLSNSIQNGRSALKWDGTNDVLSNSTYTYPSSQTSMFLAVNLTNSGTDQRIFDSAGTGYGNISLGGTTFPSRSGFVYLGSASAQTSVGAATGWRTNSFLVQGLSTLGYINGSTLNMTASGTVNYGTNTGFKFGEWWQGNDSFRFSGYMGEVLMYTGRISDVDRQRVEGYLAWKWGLQQNLPLTHLYSLRAPTRLDTFTSFSPSSISGLTLWLDAADSNTMYTTSNLTTKVSTDGDKIGGWIDKSSNAYVFYQASNTSFYPTYKTNIQASKSVARFSSSYLYSSNTMPFYTSASSGGTFFIVTQVTNNTSQGFFLTYPNEVSGTFCSSESEFGYATGAGSAGNIGFHQGCSIASVAPTNSLTTNTYTMVTALLSTSGTKPNNTKIWKNGSSLSVTADNGGFYSAGSYPYTNSNQRVRLGARVLNTQAADAFLAGDIAEIIWSRNVMSEADRQRVEGYLAWKWGLQASLPVTHPFYYGSTVSLGPISS